MKTLIVSTLFIVTMWLPQLVQAQKSVRLVTKNNNGTYEYLYYHRKAGVFQYASSTNATKIKLINLSKSVNSAGQQVYKVRFPSKKAVYTLAENGSYLVCTNPDGSVQKFGSETEYMSINKGEKEFLYTTYPISFRYRTSKSKKYIDLILVKGDMMTNIWQVRFPNSNKVYVLKGTKEGYKCTNPDGSVQVFRSTH